MAAKLLQHRPDSHQSSYSSWTVYIRYKLCFCVYLVLNRGYRRCVIALISGSSSPDTSPGWGHWIVCLDKKTLNSHSASLHPITNTISFLYVASNSFVHLIQILQLVTSAGTSAGCSQCVKISQREVYLCDGTLKNSILMYLS